MPPNNYMSSREPITEGKPDIFSRNWFRFFEQVARKIAILNGTETTSATAGAASALPATPAGYFTIIDQQGVARKVPYYNE